MSKQQPIPGSNATVMSDRAGERDHEAPNNPTGAGIVFAGGCPRSGLTLLRKMVAPHPQILAGPDTGIAPSVAFQWKNFAETLGGLHRDHFDLSPGMVAETMGRFLAGALRAESEARIIVEKTSLNVAAFEALADMLPGAKFIHVVRDGRDVVASLLERDWRDPATGAAFAHVTDPAAAIDYWASLIAAGIAAERKLAGAGRMLRLRYEDLAGRPRATLAAVCKFIGAAWPIEGAIPPALENSDYRGMERDSLPMLLGPVTPTQIGRYKKMLSPATQDLITARAGPALTALGYLPGQN